MNTSTHAAAAKLIRAELKRHGIPARVRSSSYSGGNSVTVRLTGDPLPATRQKVEEFCEQFQRGHFDAMFDMYEHSNCRDDIPQVRFVFVEIDWSPEILAAAETFASEYGLDEIDAGQILSGHHLLADEFWRPRKPRRRA